MREAKRKHAPLPWFYEAGTIYADPGRNNNPTCRPVLDLVAQGRTTSPNADLVIAAVNSHEDAMDALRAIHQEALRCEERGAPLPIAASILKKVRRALGKAAPLHG